MYRKSKKNRDEIRQAICRNRSQRLWGRSKKKGTYADASSEITPIKYRHIAHSTLRKHQYNNVVNNIHRKRLVLSSYMPKNFRYLLHCAHGPFHHSKLCQEKYKTSGHIVIPNNFSILENERESYDAICTIFSALLFQGCKHVVLDYVNCEHVDLTTQVLLDALLKDYIEFTQIVRNASRSNTSVFSLNIEGRNINNERVKRLIFSVGTPDVFDLKTVNYSDVEKCSLCTHDASGEKNREKLMEQKDIDTSELALYVVRSLKRMHKELTPSKREALCIVIGEILINAEEHSSTKYRYSIGYFQEEQIGDIHQGVFRLVIMNFGRTIYDTFKDPRCKNQQIVSKMKALSELYTRKSLFQRNSFEEETLWTLYSLQDGVTSVSPKLYRRGNGSLRFIENFFSLKGTNSADDVSYLNISSGNTRIRFDGTYGIKTKERDDKSIYKVMTFNSSGDFEEKPDSKFVRASKYFFPGTIISTKILLNDDDITILNS